MSRLPEQFHEDQALRDAARAVLFADLEHARVTLSGKGVASRVAGRIGDGAKDVIEVAKGQADDKRGIIAALVAALFLWLARGPILEILGFGPEAKDTESDVSKAADTDDLRDDWPDHQEAPFAGDALSDLETELDDTAGDIPKTPPPGEDHD